MTDQMPSPIVDPSPASELPTPGIASGQPAPDIRAELWAQPHGTTAWSTLGIEMMMAFPPALPDAENDDPTERLISRGRRPFPDRLARWAWVALGGPLILFLMVRSAEPSAAVVLFGITFLGLLAGTAIMWLYAPIRCSADRHRLESHPLLTEFLTTPTTSLEVARTLHRHVVSTVRGFAAPLCALVVTGTLWATLNGDSFSFHFHLILVLAILAAQFIASLYYRCSKLVAMPTGSLQRVVTFVGHSILEVFSLFARLVLYSALSAVLRLADGAPLIIGEIFIIILRMASASNLWLAMAHGVTEDLRATAELAEK